MFFKPKSTESLQMTDFGDAHFKLSPFLNELSDNFLLGLDLKNIRISLKWSPIFGFLSKLSRSEASKNAMYGLFLPMVSRASERTITRKLRNFICCWQNPSERAWRSLYSLVNCHIVHDCSISFRRSVRQSVSQSNGPIVLLLGTFFFFIALVVAYFHYPGPTTRKSFQLYSLYPNLVMFVQFFS